MRVRERRHNIRGQLPRVGDILPHLSGRSHSVACVCTIGTGHPGELADSANVGDL